MCESACPKNTLKIKMDREGFYRPYLIKDSCINCGLCESVCPALAKSDDFIKPKTSFAVYSKNDYVRTSCSSGGAAHEIANIMLSKNCKICGVIYDNKENIARHVISDNEIVLDSFKGSKYIQSFTVDAFKDIIRYIENQKYIVFGTPCQVAALDAYAELIKKRENLVLIDFLCHGTPSYLLWKEYIKHAQKKLGTKEFKNTKFRDKKYGWHNFTIAIDTGDKIFYSDKTRDKDLFYEFFLGNYCLNKACYKCKYRTVYSKADIRIGDFWSKKYSYDTQGVSVAITFTDVGEKIIEQLKECCFVKKESLETAIEGQINGEINIPKEREGILRGLARGKSLRYLYLREIIPYKIKRKIKKLLTGYWR